MSSQYGELRPISGWDLLASLWHPSTLQWVSCLGSITARHSRSKHQPNFAALNRGHHLYSAGWPSYWALAHVIVLPSMCKCMMQDCTYSVLFCPKFQWLDHHVTSVGPETANLTKFAYLRAPIPTPLLIRKIFDTLFHINFHLISASCRPCGSNNLRVKSSWCCWNIRDNFQTGRHPFNGLFQDNLASWHQKGYTNLDYDEAKDDWVAMASARPYANHLHFAPHR